MAQALSPPLRVAAGKTVVPELPAEFTPRPALRQRLDAATPAQVIVVSAPAGSGKTLMLADWVRQPGGPETAWISLDADDNDPRRLWSGVLSALLAHSSPSGGVHLRSVAAMAQRAEGDDLVEALADALDGPEPPIRVVLDDVHELTAREVLRDLTRLIRRSPARLRLVLSSRTDPPISVPRLRLEGRLLEVRADALRFTLDDAAAMLRATGLQLTAAQVAVLQARTDGWAAGLRLAALALRRTDDKSAFLTNFSGDERSVAEYLTVEILDGMSSDTQDFLRMVSVCSPLRAVVAVELSARADADQRLDVLCRETPLVERTSPGLYRIHPLLRSYLVADLARQRPETYRRLQEAAARWWLAEAEPVHALRHAERPGDPALIAGVGSRVGCGAVPGRGPRAVAPCPGGRGSRCAHDGPLARAHRGDHPSGRAGAPGGRRRAGERTTGLARGAERRPADSAGQRRTPGHDTGSGTPGPSLLPATASRPCPRSRHCCTRAAELPSSAIRAASMSSWPGPNCSRRWTWPA